MIQILLVNPWPILQVLLETLVAPITDLELQIYAPTQRTRQRFDQSTVVLVPLDEAFEQFLQSFHPRLQSAAAIHTLLVVPPNAQATIDIQALLASGLIHGAIALQAPILDWLTAIRAVNRGDIWLSPSLMQRLLRQTRQPGQEFIPTASRLSPRQQEVLDLAAKGFANKAIARHLHLAERTVEDHFAKIRKKLKLPSRIAAILWYQQWQSKVNENERT
jgi:DNA-binding CsgD family transcriptional regulator